MGTQKLTHGVFFNIIVLTRQHLYFLIIFPSNKNKLQLLPPFVSCIQLSLNYDQKKRVQPNQQIYEYLLLFAILVLVTSPENTSLQRSFIDIAFVYNPQHILLSVLQGDTISQVDLQKVVLSDSFVGIGSVQPYWDTICVDKSDRADVSYVFLKDQIRDAFFDSLNTKIIRLTGLRKKTAIGTMVLPAKKEGNTEMTADKGQWKKRTCNADTT